MKTIKIHPGDNVAVATETLSRDSEIFTCGVKLNPADKIPAAHKVALKDIAEGEPVIKFGVKIGVARAHIEAGRLVHTHNVKNPPEAGRILYKPDIRPFIPETPPLFRGCRRGDGSVGTRNELWIIPLSGAAANVCRMIAAENQYLCAEFGLDGIYALTHTCGDFLIGDDLVQTRRLLGALARHPNAGGVLIVGLGYENNVVAAMKESLRDLSEEHVQYMSCRNVSDETEMGGTLLRRLACVAGTARREDEPLSALTVGLKCGGNTGMTGVTANPVVGRVTDRIVAMGGSVVMTEIPEMFGAESALFSRCVSEDIFKKACAAAAAFRERLAPLGLSENDPLSDGDRDGGLTTPLEKNVGCSLKAGVSPIVDIIEYGARVRTNGLTILSGPCGDPAASTALAAAGAQVILYVSGHGTPFGTPVPTIKIAADTELYRKKHRWFDFNAGTVADGESVESAADRLMGTIIAAAAGKRVKSEADANRDISVMTSGASL